MTTQGTILNINKPTGISSFSVVRKVRKISNTKKVGHGGTLDPFASGVLLVLVGRGATSRFEELLRLTKIYHATFRLGLQTDTHDIEGEVVQDERVSVSRKVLISTVNDYVGKIEQTPPMYSAKKISGKRLYEYARNGVKVQREPAEVEIHDIVITEVKGRDIHLEVTCSAGTYIRALARDIGKDMGTGAAVTELTRTAVGEYTIDNAIPLKDLEGTWNSITA